VCVCVTQAHRYIDIFNRYCIGCTFVDPIAVPVIIHRCACVRVSPSLRPQAQSPLSPERTLSASLPSGCLKQPSCAPRLLKANFPLTSHPRHLHPASSPRSNFEGENLAEFLEQLHAEQGKRGLPSSCHHLSPVLPETSRRIQLQAGLEWTAEMFAYLFAGDSASARSAVRQPLVHLLEQPQSFASATTSGTSRFSSTTSLRSPVPICNAFPLQVVPPVHTTLGPTISVIHFHVKLTINTPSGVVNWFKQYEDAGSKDIWPISATNQVTDLFATKMHEARMALPPTGHDWKGIGSQLSAAYVQRSAHAWP
jgi:hypothetical protein